MKRKRTAIVLCVMFSLFCSGCGAKMENSAAEQKNETESADYRDTENLNDTEQTGETICSPLTWRMHSFMNMELL
jgi:uncharacterized protein YceK